MCEEREGGVAHFDGGREGGRVGTKTLRPILRVHLGVLPFDLGIDQSLKRQWGPISTVKERNESAMIVD